MTLLVGAMGGGLLYTLREARRAGTKMIGAANLTLHAASERLRHTSFARSFAAGQRLRGTMRATMRATLGPGPCAHDPATTEEESMAAAGGDAPRGRRQEGARLASVNCAATAKGRAAPPTLDTIHSIGPGGMGSARAVSRCW